jgi:hypothetical protein
VVGGGAAVREGGDPGCGGVHSRVEAKPVAADFSGGAEVGTKHHVLYQVQVDGGERQRTDGGRRRKG